MKPTDKIRIAVLYGGRSAEHEVSLQSARNVIQYLDPAYFEIIPIGIDKQGNWFVGHDVFQQSLEHKSVPKLQHQDKTWFTAEWIGKPTTGQQVKDIVLNKNGGALFDVVFPVMHGPLCEDGTLQGLLELANLPYVGCGVLASAVGMDKDISKRLALFSGISVPLYQSIKKSNWQHQQAKILSQLTSQFSFPVFVKPANTGSSVGITKVKTEANLESAIEEAFRYDTKILIEEAINALELEVAVLESLDSQQDPIVSVVGEIKTKHEFYSYEAKYIDEHGAELLIPASITDDLKEKARETAKQIFLALDCEGMARVDLFMDKNTHQIYFNEINTIPGFTTISMYPKLLEASGISYRELLTHLIQLAIKRHEAKTNLVRSYSD